MKPDDPKLQLTVEIVKLDDLSMDPANARLHSQHNLDAIKGSLRRFGQQKPIVVDDDGVVRAGNGTLEAARALGWEQIAVVRTDLEGVEAMAYGIADNRAAELATWDTDVLSACLRSLDAEDGDALAGTGFSAADVQGIIDAELTQSPPDGEDAAQEEKPIPQIPEFPVTERGEIWSLGDHWLMCGDCASSDDVAQLMGGDQINLAVSSPPYASQRKYDEGSEFKPVTPDGYSAWFQPIQANIAQHLAEDGSWFLNIKEHCEDGQRHLYVKDLTLNHARSWGWNFVDEFIWIHGGTPKAVRQRFKNGWEPIFQFTRGRHKFRPDQAMKPCEPRQGPRGWFGSGLHPNMEKIQEHGFTAGMKKQGVDVGTSTYVGGGSIMRQSASNAALQGTPEGGKEIHDAVAANTMGNEMAYPSNVLSLGKNREAVGHPAAFPLGLPEFFIRAFTDPGDLIYDPFMGSGTTLIAAQNLGRTCFGMEISPGYCDVIVKRWEEATGEKAVLVPNVGGGASG